MNKNCFFTAHSFKLSEITTWKESQKLSSHNVCAQFISYCLSVNCRVYIFVGEYITPMGMRAYTSKCESENFDRPWEFSTIAILWVLSFHHMMLSHQITINHVHVFITAFDCFKRGTSLCFLIIWRYETFF